MRIYSKSTLRDFWSKYADAEKQLSAPRRNYGDVFSGSETILFLVAAGLRARHLERAGRDAGPYRIAITTVPVSTPNLGKPVLRDIR